MNLEIFFKIFVQLFYEILFSDHVWSMQEQWTLTIQLKNNQDLSEVIQKENETFLNDILLTTGILCFFEPGPDTGTIQLTAHTQDVVTTTPYAFITTLHDLLPNRVQTDTTSQLLLTNSAVKSLTLSIKQKVKHGLLLRSLYKSPKFKTKRRYESPQTIVELDTMEPNMSLENLFHELFIGAAPTLTSNRIFFARLFKDYICLSRLESIVPFPSFQNHPTISITLYYLWLALCGGSYLGYIITNLIQEDSVLVKIFGGVFLCFFLPYSACIIGYILIQFVKCGVDYFAHEYLYYNLAVRKNNDNSNNDNDNYNHNDNNNDTDSNNKRHSDQHHFGQF